MHLLFTFLLSMAPIAELRVAIPYGIAAGYAQWLVFVVAVIGNMVPVPFIIIFIRRIFEIMRNHSPKLDKVVTRMEQKAEKNKEMVLRYQMIGLFILVAIPLPGTGAWTGALVAAMMEMRLKKAIFPIFAGVVAAGLVMTFASVSIKGIFF